MVTSPRFPLAAILAIASCAILSFSGCSYETRANKQWMTASRIHCEPAEVQLSDMRKSSLFSREESRSESNVIMFWTTSVSWTATCRGKAFVCREIAQGLDCSPKPN